MTFANHLCYLPIFLSSFLLYFLDDLHKCVILQAFNAAGTGGGGWVGRYTWSSADRPNFYFSQMGASQCGWANWNDTCDLARRPPWASFCSLPPHVLSQRSLLSPFTLFPVCLTALIHVFQKSPRIYVSPSSPPPDTRTRTDLALRPTFWVGLLRMCRYKGLGSVHW